MSHSLILISALFSAYWEKKNKNRGKKFIQEEIDNLYNSEINYIHC
jgi:hypothetical protein